MNQLVRVDLSQAQHIPAGNLLSKMFYSGFITDTLSREQFSGYPHNGGQHSLWLSLTPADMQDFLDIVRSRFEKHPGLPEFISSAITRLKARYPALQVQ